MGKSLYPAPIAIFMRIITDTSQGFLPSPGSLSQKLYKNY